MKELTHNIATGQIIETDLTTDQINQRQIADTEFAWFSLRATRDQLLAASDWTVLGDSPTPTAAWKVYRQALRDLPANTTDPFNVDWPTPPA